MKLKWKRIWDKKNYNFEVDFLISSKLNGGQINLPKIFLEDQELTDQIKSVHENYVLSNINRVKVKKKLNDLNDEKTRVRNHFRNICFRKKFNTIKDHIKYISDYYQIPQLKTLEYVEEDLPIIKKQVGLK